MEKYYGNADEYGNCSEECKKLNTGRCIGSIACSECTYCAGSGKDDYGSVTWIKCRYLDEAIGKDVD